MSEHSPAGGPQDPRYQDLVQRAKSASEEERRQIIDALVTQFTDAAYRWALLILGDEEKASDALQEAWIAAFLHLHQLREDAAFPSWFRQLVITSCYHALRDEKRALPLEEFFPEADPAQPDLIDDVATRERSEQIREAVLKLPEHERLVTELYYFSDLPQQDIAEVLAIPVTTVKKRLQYARKRLKGLLQPEIVAHLATMNALSGDDTNALFEPFLPTAEPDDRLRVLGLYRLIHDNQIAPAARPTFEIW